MLGNFSFRIIYFLNQGIIFVKLPTKKICIWLAETGEGSAENPRGEDRWAWIMGWEFSVPWLVWRVVRGGNWRSFMQEICAKLNSPVVLLLGLGNQWSLEWRQGGPFYFWCPLCPLCHICICWMINLRNVCYRGSIRKSLGLWLLWFELGNYASSFIESSFKKCSFWNAGVVFHKQIFIS